MDITTGSYGVGAGHKCDFPFYYDGDYHDECIFDGQKAGPVPWCGVNGFNGRNGNWGMCQCDLKVTRWEIKAEEEEEGAGASINMILQPANGVTPLLLAGGGIGAVALLFSLRVAYRSWTLRSMRTGSAHRRLVRDDGEVSFAVLEHAESGLPAECVE